MNRFDEKMLDMEHSVSGPAFRWNLAQRLASSQRTSRLQQADEQIQQASAYLRMCQEVGREQADRKYPAMAAACRLTENEQSFLVLKLSILGTLPRAEVAARLGVEQQVIDVAEALFFDISGRRQASGWMNCHVFVPEARFGSKEGSAKMKLAQYGGPLVARALLDGQEELPLEEAQQIVDQNVQLHAKLQAALEFDLDAQSAEQFLKIYLEYDLQRRKLQLEHERFQLECARARERRIADEADRENDSSNDAACDRTSSLGDDQVQLTGMDSDDEQLVA